MIFPNGQPMILFSKAVLLMAEQTLSPKRARPSLGARIGREIRKNHALYVLILLPLAVLIIFHYVPMHGVQIAFRNYKPARGIYGSEWVGLKYFEKYFSSKQFWPLIRNTLSINLYSLATFPLGLILALLLNYLPSKFCRKTVQMVSYAPHFISTVVMCGMLLQFLDVRTGMINEIVKLLGGKPVNFMGQPAYFYSIYVWSGVWQGLGYSSIIYIAALAGIDPELHEAAIVDGASIVKRIWHVDIPGVLPTVCILLILRCGSLMSIGFEKILLLQNNLNKPISNVIATYTYQIGLNSSGTPQYSYAAAIGMFNNIVNMILLFTVNTVTRRMSGTGLF